ncbi:MAG: V-type ATP synthase subunit D [Oscillospiraceae bacterium]|nr:V-type ATP synthase subunit D [Oscillospiraceae bacterium]
MSKQVFPTKSNLIATKKSLALSSTGFNLLDKKRNILIREMMLLIEKFQDIRTTMSETFQNAYAALQKANIELGVIDDIAAAVPIDENVSIRFKSVMGVDIPIVNYNNRSLTLSYGFFNTNSDLDYAYRCFHEVKKLTVILAELENSIYRLADAISKIQRRANALKNVVIPDLEAKIKFITDYLEEKEREEFFRLKVIKNRQDG